MVRDENSSTAFSCGGDPPIWQGQKRPRESGNEFPHFRVLDHLLVTRESLANPPTRDSLRPLAHTVTCSRLPANRPQVKMNAARLSGMEMERGHEDDHSCHLLWNSRRWWLAARRRGP